MIFPWKLMAAGHYVFTWLLGVSALMGPIGAILIVDYFLIRKKELDIDDLYRRQGRYTYRGGFNPWAIIALTVAVLPNLPGFLAAAELTASAPDFFVEIYKYAWFVGFIVGGLVYWGLMALFAKEHKALA